MPSRYPRTTERSTWRLPCSSSTSSPTWQKPLRKWCALRARVERRRSYVWDYAGEMQMMRRFWDAAVALNPAALDKDEGRRFPVCRPEPVTALYKNAGLANVEVRAIDAPTVFENFDDYWAPFLGGQAPAPGYCMSLSEDLRAALRDRVRSTLPFRDDGSVHLIARAWAVRGTA